MSREDEGAVGLIRFRFRTAMLVADAVFIEQLFHLRRDHVTVVRDGDQRDLFPGFRGLGLVGLFGCGIHRYQYTRSGFG